MKHFADHAFMRRWVLSSIGLILIYGVYAQDIAIGTWRTHFSYQNAKYLSITSEKIFCASENGFFSRNLDTGETRKLSKIDGLSDTGISALAYDQSQEVLVIGYRSGFVDFVFNDRILSIDDLANSNLDINKTINDIAFGSDKTYLATDIGVIVVNTASATVKENFVNIGESGKSVAVLEILLADDKLFIRTSNGIQSGSLSKNLLDFSNWDRYDGSVDYSNLIKAGSTIYATSGENLLQFSTDWIDSGIDLPTGATKLFEVDGILMTSDNLGSIYQLNDSFDLTTSIEDGMVNDIVSDGSNLFFAHSQSGLIDQNGNKLSPDGPVSDIFSNFRVINKDLYGFHAPSPFSYNGTIKQEEFSVFTNGRWEARSIEGFYNVSDIALFNGVNYYSSIGSGLYNASNDEIVTDIPGSAPSLDTVITSLAGKDALWVSSFENDDPIHLLSEDMWTSFSEGLLFDNEFLTIDLSETGLGWLGSSSGFISVLDPIEQNVEVLNTADGLPSFFIDIDISIEDNAWVATPKGPAFFPDASFIFFSSDAIRPTFENRILFDDEAINAVMTDGGNRIWFGTNNGIWIYDENTSQQVGVFQEENSPLPSNRIIQLAYNGSNGEVFIYTDKGMVSYRSSSSLGSRTHRNVNIFPNPVRPDYNGLVGMTGLARNVRIKVTDINGNLVQQIDSNGGTASWNLRNMRGGSVNTGIYLFFSSNSDGQETYIGKIAVIR